MNNDLVFTIAMVTFAFTYLIISCFTVKRIRKIVTNTNPYIRLLILSLSYAVFWAPGIATFGGDPGFGFPAPNLAAILLVTSAGLYRSIWVCLLILACWWVVIFLFMLMVHFTNTLLRNTKPDK